MINITEKEALKVSGETTLFVEFPYKPNYVDIVKRCYGYYWHKDLTAWEIPIIYLSVLLDEFCQFDDIKLKFYKPIVKEVSQDFILSEYKLPALDYQIEDIKYGLTHDKWLLLNQPGTGKTMISLHIAEELKKQGKIEHCLILCGMNALKANWVKEVQKHTNLSCMVLGERVNRNNVKVQMTSEKKIEQLKQPIEEFFIITGVASLRNEKIIKELNQGINKIDMVVVDEAHKCKDPSSQQGNGLLKLKNAKYKISMTGTLILNNPLDAYLSLRWIGVEKSTITTFKQTYCTFFGKMITGYKNLDLLKSMIDGNSVRRMKDMLNLPSKTIINEYVEMEQDQANFYNIVKKGVKEERDKWVDKVKINTTNLLALVTRLRQVTSCPSVLTSENISIAKIDRACDLVEQLIENNRKVVIFSSFKETIRVLGNLLSKYNPLIATGDDNDDEVDKRITRFQTDESCKILIGTWQKIGTGLDLYAASEAIFIDVPWTQAVFDQCCDRLHRIGQKNPITIYHLITEDTIDERCAEILEFKGTISDYLIDGKITENGLAVLKKYIEEL